MWQQGQVFQLKATSMDGQLLWAYRYRLEPAGRSAACTASQRSWPWFSSCSTDVAVTAAELRGTYDRRVASVATKLQLKPGQAVAVLRLPSGVEFELPPGCVSVTDSEKADAVIVFVRDRAEFDSYAGPALGAAARDALAWIAYPKAAQLATDLNRDRLAAAAREHGVQPVRQIAVDDVWSALRFRPATRGH